MERSTWTDERLDDLTRHIDSRFNAVDSRFDRVDSDIRDLRGEVAGLRSLGFRVALGGTIAWMSILAAIVAHG